MNIELISKKIIQDIGENEQSKALIDFLNNKKFSVRQIGHNSYNYTLVNSDVFIREEDTFTSDFDNEQTILYLILPDLQSHCGKFYIYDNLSEETRELIINHLWGAR